jgi:hypothetical protein
MRITRGSGANERRASSNPNRSEAFLFLQAAVRWMLPLGYGFFHLKLRQSTESRLAYDRIGIFFGDLPEQLDILEPIHRLPAYIGIGISPTRDENTVCYHHGLLSPYDHLVTPPGAG